MSTWNSSCNGNNRSTTELVSKAPSGPFASSSSDVVKMPIMMLAGERPSSLSIDDPGAASSSVSTASASPFVSSLPHLQESAAFIGTMETDRRNLVGVHETMEMTTETTPAMTGYGDYGRTEWMESLKRTCLDRARQAKKRRRIWCQGEEEQHQQQQQQQEALFHAGLGLFNEASSYSHSTALLLDRSNDDDDNDVARRNHDDASYSSKRRRRRLSEDLDPHEPSTIDDRSLFLAAEEARRTINDALQEQQQQGTDMMDIRHAPCDAMINTRRRGSDHQTQQQRQFAMTNDEWQDLLRQVQEELEYEEEDDNDLDIPENYFRREESLHHLDEDNDNNDDDEWIERVVEAERAEQEYWNERAAEWITGREVEEGERGNRWNYKQATNEPVYDAQENGNDVDSVPLLCPVCQEASLLFVAINGEAETTNDMMTPTGSAAAAGSLLCPNHMDGSCTMHVDHAFRARRDAFKAMQRLLCDMHEQHSFASGGCGQPPLRFDVTNDQVLHATCDTCQWTTSIPFASWFSRFLIDR